MGLWAEAGDAWEGAGYPAEARKCFLLAAEEADRKPSGNKAARCWEKAGEADIARERWLADAVATSDPFRRAYALKHAGSLEEAASAYAQASRAYKRLPPLAIRLPRLESAERCWRAAQRSDRADAMWAEEGLRELRSGRTDNAAQLFRRVRDPRFEPRNYVREQVTDRRQGGDLLGAAALLHDVGEQSEANGLRAEIAAAAEARGDWRGAADAWLLACDFPRGDAALKRHAADLESGGDLAAAAEAWRRAGDRNREALALRKLATEQEAADAFRPAAATWRRLGDTDRARRALSLRAGQLEANGNLRAAVRLWRDLGDMRRVAELLRPAAVQAERRGYWNEAAARWTEAGELWHARACLGRAAQIHDSNHRPRQAASLWARLGNIDAACRSWERVGTFTGRIGKWFAPPSATAWLGSEPRRHGLRFGWLAIHGDRDYWASIPASRTGADRLMIFTRSLERAAEIAEGEGLTQDAAELWQAAGQHLRAARLWLSTLTQPDVSRLLGREELGDRQL